MDASAIQSSIGPNENNAREVTLSAVIIVPSSSIDRSLLKRAEQSIAFADEIIIDQAIDTIIDFAYARNNALGKTHGEWVLFIDADEEVTESLSSEIRRVLHQLPITHHQSPDGFKIRRQDYFLGRWMKYGETGGARFLRLARKDAGRWVRPVHEEWVVSGPVGILHEPLLHRSHQSVISMLGKIDRYAQIEAEFRKRTATRSRFQIIAEMIVFPKVKFIQNYLLRRGYLDGFPGFIMALMMSFHSFLVRAYQVERNLAKRDGGKYQQ